MSLSLDKATLLMSSSGSSVLTFWKFKWTTGGGSARPPAAVSRSGTSCNFKKFRTQPLYEQTNRCILPGWSRPICHLCEKTKSNGVLSQGSFGISILCRLTAAEAAHCCHAGSEACGPASVTIPTGGSKSSAGEEGSYSSAASVAKPSVT